MRKLLQIGLLVAAFTAGCESSTNPVGPGRVVIVESTSTIATSTTTSVIPALRFVASPSISQNQPNVPSDVSLFLRPAAGGSAATSSLLTRLAGSIGGRAAATYDVVGFFSMPNGVTGDIKGVLEGSPDNGTFTGTLSTVVPECTEEREFRGPVSNQFLQWTGGAWLPGKECRRRLAFAAVTLLKSDAPPPTTTSVPTTSSTSTSSSTTTSAVQCSYALSPTSALTGPAAGDGNVNVSTGPTCEWSVAATVSWLTILTPIQNTGPSAVRYLVAENQGAQRTGSLIIAGIPFFVTQNAPAAPTTTTTTTAPPCTYSLSPTSRVVEAPAGQDTIQLTTTNGCAWTVSSSVGWLTLQSAASGTGSTTVRYAFAANTGPQRTGVLVVAGIPFVVTQNAAPHTLTIGQPFGTPNPVAGQSPVTVRVEASDSLGHPLIYAWSSTCPGLASNGTFTSVTTATTTWTAPPYCYETSANLQQLSQTCTLLVKVDDGAGLTQTVSYSQVVNAVICGVPERRH